MTTFETTITQGNRRLVVVKLADDSAYTNLAIGGDGRFTPGPDPTTSFYARAAVVAGDSVLQVSVDTAAGPSTSVLTVHTVAVVVPPDVRLDIAGEEPDPEP